MAARAPQQKAYWRIELPDEAATDSLALDLGQWLRRGDLLTLSGELGTGKTTFARALIRGLALEQDLEVPSPTFTLMQVYESGAFPILHADFYRIQHADELIELGFDEAQNGTLTIVEWPERGEPHLAANRLNIAFEIDPQRGADYRVATLTGTGPFVSRLNLARAMHDILASSGWAGAERRFMQGDASIRSYERLVKPDGATALLMTFPPRPDGPAVRYGKSYSALARLAEDIRPFVAIDRGLRAQSFSAPEIFAADLDAGLAIIEDFGDEGMANGQAIAVERYAEAVAVLARLHQANLPDALPTEAASYRIPPYDIDALSIEIELLLDWYAPHIAKATLASGAKANFVNLWRQVLRDIAAARATWTLRDYHSPNLFWLAKRDGLARVGIIDFQDCVLGHPAYDVVSLLQDARVDVPDEVELRLLGHYAQLRRAADPGFDMAGFARAYALLGAQRATKILGIFARLDKRDHKPQYLAHLPRVEKYLAKDLAHPLLSALKGWYETHLPRALNKGP
ncbi:MAG: tRNA (adenosine(37)-N6)-threonylcarbamoyltransferase complex ATPase subunit type 1 TsaE [Methylovirgula sp.]